MSFDELVAPKIAEQKPVGQHPGSGKKEDAMDTMLYKHVKGENHKPHTNVIFKGIVLYKTIRTYKEFSDLHDPVFVEYCTRVSPDAQGLDKDKLASLSIVEAIVYIQELCATLPQPLDTQKYFEGMKQRTKKFKPNHGAAAAANQLVGNQEESVLREENRTLILSKKDIEQIRRYPKAYAIVEDKTKSSLSLQSIVEVQFPYNFDFSHCIIKEVL
jgi:hypothetical protein|tara:strand:- start:2791 stop:3435 length:645 start_codon:yes stop_codon:yes gene_type:complete